MRLLHRQTEERQAAYVSGGNGNVAHEAVAGAETQEKRQEQVAAAGAELRGEAVTARRQVRRRSKWRLLTRKQIAAVTLAMTGLFGLRWYAANREPVYPALGGGARIAGGTLVMDGPNAAHFYGAAADALPAKLEDGKLEEMSVAEQRAEVARAAESLDLLRQGFPYRYQGAGRTAWMKTGPEEGLNAPVPNFMSQRKIARLLAAEARVKAAAGDTAGALASSLDAVRFGQDVGSQSHTLIEGMIGILIESIGETEALKHVGGLNAADARAAARRVEAMTAREVPFAQVMDAERRFGYAALGEFFNDHGVIEGELLSHMDPWKRFRLEAMSNGLIVWRGRQGIVDDYTRTSEQFMTRAALPYQQAKALGEIPESKDWLMRIMVPNSRRAHQGHARAAMRRRVLAARLAVEAYRAEHGGVAPASLDELTLGPAPYLSAVPPDPFSPDGTAPLRYKDGNAYSVGDNGADDGGTGDDDPLYTPSR